MLTTFIVDFRAALNGGSLGFARLDRDLAFAPTPDIQYEHPVWHKARRPASVKYNIDEQSFHVILQHDDIDPKDLKAHTEMYGEHKWTVHP